MCSCLCQRKVFSQLNIVFSFRHLFPMILVSAILPLSFFQIPLSSAQRTVFLGSLTYRNCGIYGDLFNDEPSYSSYIKRFIDLLLNKYGALPTHKREAIYFRHKHTIITECIAKHRRIRIKTYGEEFIIKPYSLLVDPSVRYLYLTGYVDDKDIFFQILQNNNIKPGQSIR